MALVKAKEDCYLNEHGYRKEGEVFEYPDDAPKHHCLEKLKGKPEATTEEPK